MRPFFLFHYAGRVYASVALPVGWGRSPYWFTRLLKPMVGWLRRNGFRVLANLDDFLLGLRAASAATAQDCRAASEVVQDLLDALVITRHPMKGTWGDGATKLEHLGILLDTEALTFTLRHPRSSRCSGCPLRCLRLPGGPSAAWSCRF
jgi:hypothetical protein